MSWRFIVRIDLPITLFPIFVMATPFFPDEWEALTAEQLATARARLAGFIEAVPDKDKILIEV